MKTTTITKTKTSKTSKTIQQDTCAVIRLGRLANAVAFAKRAHRDAVIHPRVIRRRQVHQATFLMAGYLAEAITLIEDLMPVYGLAPAFSELLVFRSAISRNSDILTAFNFSPAYHQDVRSDRKTEDEIKLQELDLNALAAACYSSADIAYLHYPAIYKFDTASCARDLQAGFNREQFLQFVKAELPYFAECFLAAANVFITRTTAKLQR